jgi:hypothetical protein
VNYVVAGCWTMSLGCAIWLRHYWFGPLEWCWRSLIYWKRQPTRIKRPSAALIAAGALSDRTPSVETRQVGEAIISNWNACGP